MNKDETITIVGLLNASYPNNKMDDSAAIVFANFLLPLDFECCRYAVKLWIERQKWFPSIAEVVEATRHEMRRVLPDSVAALPSGGRTLSREENQQRLAEIQAQLAEAKGPLFNPRTRREALESEGRPGRPARR